MANGMNNALIIAYFTSAILLIVLPILFSIEKINNWVLYDRIRYNIYTIVIRILIVIAFTIYLIIRIFNG